MADAHGCAFGLELEADFAVPGITDQPAAAAVRGPCRLELVEPEALRRSWHGSERLSDRPRIESNPAGDVLFDPDEFGTFWLSASGRTARCAPSEDQDEWRWQRYLVGQVLPYAAVLHGLEVFHASAIVFGGAAISFSGTTASGKTSIAAQLLLAGASFLTDDVLVVERSSDEVLVHPAAGLLNLRHGSAEQLGAEAVQRLGTPVGADDDAVRLSVPRHPRPTSLDVFVLLRRTDSRQVRLSDAAALEPLVLLASTFNFLVRTPERLERQLDVCAAIARRARLLAAEIPDGGRIVDLAEAVEGALQPS